MSITEILTSISPTLKLELGAVIANFSCKDMHCPTDLRGIRAFPIMSSLG
jgi:hypothetical protein